MAVLIALVWGFLQLIGMFRDSDSDMKANPKPSAAPSQTEPTPSPVSESPEPEPAVVAGEPVPVGLVTAETACEPENVRTVAMVPTGQKAGGPVQVELLLSSIDGTACTFTPAARDFLIVVEANEKPVYDSTVCKAPVLNSPVVIAQGYGTLVRATWSGRGSGRDCNPKEGFVKGGKFVLKVSAFGGEPDQTKFTLASAPKPSPKPSASPSASSSPKPSASSSPSSDPQSD